MIEHKSLRLKRNQCHIIKRIIVHGILVLDTPTCIGSGDTEGATDMMLLRDSISQRVLLTGASIAGALRNYINEREYGFEKYERKDSYTTKLFGHLFYYPEEDSNKQLKIQEQEENQSALIIDDALSIGIPDIEMRDGVKIDSVTRTAVDEAKYDFELLQAGTEFPLSFELLIEKDVDEEKLINAFALSLHGFEPSCKSSSEKSGEICVGMKKRRGFGRCHVKQWQVWQFDLRKPNDLLAWLKFEHWHTDLPLSDESTTSIRKAFAKVGIELSQNWEDNRNRITIETTFTLASSLLIGSSQASTNKAPDAVHLKSQRDGGLKSILSGTSLAGVLRHRAERIINTLTIGNKEPFTKRIISQVFGFVEGKREKLGIIENDKAKASRLIVQESIIEGTTKNNDLVQTRIAIDRFTGGTLHGALFDEQPIFSSDNTILVIKLELRQPEDYEIGLLLLLLKDLWTEDLPVGGTSSIGRGRLQGIKANITHYKAGNSELTWTISQLSKKEPVTVTDANALEEYVAALHKEVAA